MYPPGNGGCGGKIQEKNSLLVHDSKLQTMIEKFLVIYLQVHEHDHVENFRYSLIWMVCNIFRQFGTKCEAIINIAKG